MHPLTTFGPPPVGLEVINHLALPQLCGQLLVTGFSGTTLPTEVKESLSAGLLAGVILFSRNLPNLDTAFRLIESIHACQPPELPLWVAIDQEGGRVARLPLPAPKLPPMRAFGDSGDLELTRRAAQLVGKQLRSLGVNCNFAPVVDVDSNPNNPVIGDRAFSSDPKAVASFARAFARGLQETGVMACAKHFPGHGDTSEDSHFTLPSVLRTREQLEQVELAPFRAIAGEVEAVMTAHVRYPALDATGVAATLSEPIVTGLLRDSLHFEGVCFSDDLEMGAVGGQVPIEQTTLHALRAGCDVMLVCHRPELTARALGALVAAAEEEPEVSFRVVQSAIRSLTARRRYPHRQARSLADALPDLTASAIAVLSHALSS